MAKAAGPFTVIYGEEEFLLDRVVDRRKKAWKNRTIVNCDGGDLNASKLVALCETSSFFEEGGRVVVLDNAQDLKGSDKPLLEFITNKDAKDFSTLILAVVRSKSVPSVWQEASRKGSMAGFARPKPWETSLLTSRIEGEAKDLGLKFEPGVVQLFFQFVGSDLRSTVNELNKLKHLVGEDNLVKKEHLRVMAATASATPKDVTEAALAKNATKAMRAMSLVYRDNGEGACVQVAYSLLKELETVLLVRHMLDKGEPTSVIAARVSKHEYVCKSTLIPVAQKHTTRALIGQMQNLCKLDAQVKGAARSKRTLVELAVLSIAA